MSQKVNIFIYLFYLKVFDILMLIQHQLYMHELTGVLKSLS